MSYVPDIEKHRILLTGFLDTEDKSTPKDTTDRLRLLARDTVTRAFDYLARKCVTYRRVDGLRYDVQELQLHVYVLSKPDIDSLILDAYKAGAASQNWLQRGYDPHKMDTNEKP